MEIQLIGGSKPEITIGVLGQDGHGKTSLTAAIVQTLSRQNGSSVEGDEIVVNPGDCREANRLPFFYETAVRRYTHIDCHRHIDVTKNLILNWFPLQGAILVVSSVEGITDQTREQVRLAHDVGVAALVVFLNKCDLTEDTELPDIAELEVRELLAGYGYAAKTPIIRGSATAALNNLETDRFDLWNGKIRDLLDAMDAALPVPPSIQDGPFLMSVEEVFIIQTKGTIVTGRAERGIYRSNSPVEVVGFGPTWQTVATCLEQFHKKCDTIYGGDNAGVMLRSANRTNAQRGQVLAAPGTIQAASWFRAVIYLPTRQEKGSDRPDLSDKTLEFFIRTTWINGTLELEERTGPLRGGDTIRAAAVLESYIALEPGLRFTLREKGRSIGIGVITEILF